MGGGLCYFVLKLVLTSGGSWGVERNEEMCHLSGQAHPEMWGGGCLAGRCRTAVGHSLPTAGWGPVAAQAPVWGLWPAAFPHVAAAGGRQRCPRQRCCVLRAISVCAGACACCVRFSWAVYVRVAVHVRLRERAEMVRVWFQALYETTAISIFNTPQPLPVYMCENMYWFQGDHEPSVLHRGTTQCALSPHWRAGKYTDKLTFFLPFFQRVLSFCEFCFLLW